MKSPLFFGVRVVIVCSVKTVQYNVWWAWAVLCEQLYSLFVFTRKILYFYMPLLLSPHVCSIPTRVVVVFSMLVVCLDVMVSWVSLCFPLSATEFWFPRMYTLFNSTNSCLQAIHLCNLLLHSDFLSSHIIAVVLAVICRKIPCPIHIFPSFSK